MGTLEAQCYSCGRWHSGYDIGHAYSELMHLSTQYQKAQLQRKYSYSGGAQTADAMHFEDSLSQTPEVVEIPCDPSDFDI